MVAKKANQRKKPVKRGNPFSEKADKAADKKAGIKENSARDKRMDRRGR